MAHLFKAGKLVAEFLHHQLGKVDELFFIRAVAIEAVALRDCPALHRKKKMRARPHRIRYIPWDRWEGFFPCALHKG